MGAEMYEEAKELARAGMLELSSLEEQELYIFEREHGAKSYEIDLADFPITRSQWVSGHSSLG